MHELNFRTYFLKKYARLVKNNTLLDERVEKTLENLKADPHMPSLKTHKAYSKRFGKVFSSLVTGDIRITWDYNKKMIRVLDIYDIGGHSGSKKVYS